MDYPGGSKVITRILQKREGRRVRARDRDVRTEAEVRVMQGCKPRSGQTLEAGEGQEVDFSLEPPEGAQPANRLQIPTFQNPNRINVCGLKPLC